MYEFKVAAEGDGELTIQFALSDDGKRFRARCSCDPGERGMPCGHIEDLVLSGPPDDACSEEVLDAFATAESIIGDVASFEDIEGKVEELAKIIAEVQDAERDVEAARKEPDRDERQMAVEFARERLRESKESVRESEKELGKFAKAVVRLHNGASSNGRVRESGWPDFGDWPLRTAEEIREIAEAFLAQLKETARSRAPSFATPTARRSKQSTEDAGCLSAAVIFVVAALLR